MKSPLKKVCLFLLYGSVARKIDLFLLEMEAAEKLGFLLSKILTLFGNQRPVLKQFNRDPRSDMSAQSSIRSSYFEKQVNYL